MKFLIYFLFLFIFASCSSNTKVSSEASSPEETTSAVVEENPDKKKKVFEHDKDKNPLSEEARELQINRKVRDLDFLGFKRNPLEEYTNSNVICRRFQGCRRFCAEISQQNRDCNQWPVRVVLQSWKSVLKQYDIHELIDHTEWMGRYRDVTAFLRSVDSSHSIVQHIASRLSSGECKSQERAVSLVYKSPSDQSSSLYVSDGENEKKIMDSNLFHFDNSLFQGVLNKCLYYQLPSEQNFSEDDSSEGSYLSLTEYMVAYNNEIGFGIAHEILAQSCGNRNECIQLAYCSMDSENVWSYVDKNRYEFGLDIQARAALCSYENFHSLPPDLASVVH